MNEAVWLAQRLVNDPDNTSISSIGLEPMCAALWKADTGRLLVGHLRKYQLALGDEWELLFSRTHKSIIEGRFMDEYPVIGDIVWKPEVHHSHRVHLLKKDSAHYRPKFDLFDLPINEEWVKYDWSRPTTV